MSSVLDLFKSKRSQVSKRLGKLSLFKRAILWRPALESLEKRRLLAELICKGGAVPNDTNRGTAANPHHLRRFATRTHGLVRKRFPLYELLETRALLTVTVNTFADVVDDDGLTSFREAIELASGIPGEVVELPAGTYELALGELPITDAAPLTIQSVGGFAKIDALGASRVFSIGTEAVVTLVGLQMTGGYSSLDGGAVFNQGTLSIQDSELWGNRADGSGGGLHNSAMASVIRTLFQDNHAGGYGGGLANLGIFGGSGDMTVTDSQFIGNNSGLNGGGLDNNGFMTIAASRFEANEAMGRGGAIGNGGTISMLDSQIVANASRYQGGGIFNAVVNDLLSSTLDIAGTLIEGNVSRESWGGGLSSFGIATLSSSSVLSNEARNAGGGIDAYLGSLVVSETTIDGNRALNLDGGGIHSYDATLEIHNSFITNNQSFTEGGGVATYFKSAMIANTIIDDNTSLFGPGGGLFRYGQYGALTIDGGSVSGNTASSSGGGIFVDGYASLMTITGTVIEENSSVNGSGGGVSLNGYYGTTTIAGAAIENNVAVNGSGGGVFFNSYYGTTSIAASVISNNLAAFAAGISANGYDSVSIVSNTISVNQGTGLALSFTPYAQVLGNTISDNAGDGIQIEYGYYNTIGTPDNGNIVTGNSGAGVAVRYGYDGNSIRGNVIHSNAGLAIDLGGDGRTANDQQDADFGPNALQNYPIIDSLEAGATTQVTGHLDSTPNSYFTIDLYAQLVDGPVNPGSSARYLGSVDVLTDASGFAAFDTTLDAAIAADELVSATATDWNGSTSEFSDFNLIRVYPNTGLATTENGAKATFQVVLALQPTSTVTIPLLSSDPGEGKLAKSSIEFSPTNWNTPQIVTVTGADDDIADGPNEYLIQTGSAISTDLRFNGIDSDDVQITNYDNEFPAAQLIPPAGSLMYRTGLESVISASGQPESFSLLLDAGQTLSVLVEPSQQLRPKIEIYNSSGELVATATADAAGAKALVQTLRIPGQIAGNGGKPSFYTVRVTGEAETLGTFHVAIFLNTALETEQHGGLSNDSLAAAQSLTDAFITLNTSGTSSVQPARAAVVGQTGRDFYGVDRFSGTLRRYDSETGAELQSVQMFVDGNPVDNAFGLAVDPTTQQVYALLSYSGVDTALVSIDVETGLGTQVADVNAGGQRFTDIAFDSAGKLYGLTGDRGIDSGSLFAIDPSDGTLTFLTALTNSGGGTGESLAYNPDDGLLYRFQAGVFESIDPNRGFAVTSIPVSGPNPYQSQALTYVGGGEFRLARFAELYSLTTAGEVTFLAYLPSDSSRIHGLAFVGDQVDYYSLRLSEGQSATLSVSGAGATIELLNSTGASLAKGVAANDGGQVISEFFATSSGTYYVQINRVSGGDYTLLVTRNSSFDNQDNNSFGSAHDLIGPEVAAHRWALGHVSGIGQLLGADGPDGNLILVDSNSGAASIVASNVGGGNGFNDLARNPVTNVIYGAQARGQSGLYTIDSSSYTETFVGDMGGNIRALTWSPDGATLYGFRDFEFGTIDANDGTFTVIGNPGLFYVGGMAFEPGTGTLYAITNIDPGLYTIDLTTGAATYIGDPGDRYNALEFLADGTLLAGVARPALNFPAGSMVQLDPLTAVPTLIGWTVSYGFQNLTGLESLPAVGDFYRIRASGNKTITIETSLPASASGNFVNDLDPMLRLYNASGDLVASNDNRSSRDRNAKLEYKVPRNGGGDFYIEVAASEATSTPTQGEYFLSVKGAEAPALEPFAVAAINTADGQRVRGPVTTLTIDFNDIALLSSLQASDIQIDGVSASGIEMIDGNTVIATIGQVLSEGNHTVTIAAGALRDIQNTPIQVFSSSFYHDVTAPRIVYSSIQEGEVVSTGLTDLTIQVEFSEAMDTTQVLWDFPLFAQLTGSFHYPTAAAFDAGGTELTLTFAGVNEDLYTLTMASGDFALQDTVGWDLDGEALVWPIPNNTTGDGVEGGNFVVTFAADASTRNVPFPLVAVNPLGSLIYRTASASSGAILPVGDTDDWTIELDPGQTISVLLDPSFSLAGSIEIIAPDNTTVGSAIGSVTNQTVLLQTAPAVAGGVYTIRIGGDSGTIGQYSFEITVNAALEEETYGGPSNDDTGSAQSLESSFISLPNGATRGAVLGQTPRLSAIIDEIEPNNDAFQAQNIDSGMWNLLDNPYIFDSTSLPHLSIQGTGDGTYDYYSFTVSTFGALGIFDIDFSTNLDSWLDILDSSGNILATSDDAGFDPGSFTGLDSLIFYTFSTPGTYYVRVSGYPARPVPGGTTYNLHVSLQDHPLGSLDPGPDIYSLTLADNQSASIAATSLTGGDVNIHLLGSDGNVIATGIDVGTNVTELIAFAGGMAGTYYVQVTGDSAVDYSLVVTRDAILEIEDNNSPLSAQVLDLSTGSSTVLGYFEDQKKLFFNAFDSGWYLDSGFHDPANQNYFTGFAPGFGELRGFWAFDLAGLSSSNAIVGAHLELFSGLTSDTDFSETIAFYDVTTPVDELVAGGGGLVDIYADLGSGIFFGSREVFFYEDFTVLQFGLNADAITEVLAAAGNQFAIGSALTTIDFNSFEQSLFGFSSDPANLKRLVLDIAEQDYYEVTLAAGQTLNLETSTPGGGSGEFVNNLDPVVRVYDADGNVVAQDDNSADGRNAMLAFLSESAGTYWIEVGSSGGSGEYTLSLTTIDGPAPRLQKNSFVRNSGPSHFAYSDANWFDGHLSFGDSVAASFEAGNLGVKLLDPKPVHARSSAPFAWMPTPDQSKQSDWLAEGRLKGSQTPFDKHHRAEHLDEKLVDQVFGKNLDNGWENWL